MSKVTKRVVFGSWFVAGVVAVAAIVDLIWKFPFSGKIVMDILFLVSAGVVGYLGYDTFEDMS